jgi:hypothetical protein
MEPKSSSSRKTRSVRSSIHGRSRRCSAARLTRNSRILKSATPASAVPSHSPSRKSGVAKIGPISE